MQYLLLVILVQISLAREWIDPHDMKMNTMYGPEISNQEEIKQAVTVADDKSFQDTKEEINFVHLKRIVSLLVSSASPDQEKDSLLKGIYYFNKEAEEYKFLLKFIKSEKSEPNDLRQLDSILQSAFRNNYTENILNIILSTNDIFLYLLNSRTIILLAACIALLIFIHLLRSNYSFWYIFNYFLFIIWIVDYAIRYQMLLEEADIHNIGVTSPECKKLNWYDYFFKDDGKCEKINITPIEVALRQLKYIIIIPLNALGTGTGGFVKEVWSQLPFPYNFIIFPMTLLMVLLMVPAIMTILNGQSFKINIMHLFHVQYGNQHESSHRFNESTLEKLLYAMNQKSAIMNASSPSTFKRIKRNKDVKKKEKLLKSIKSQLDSL